MSSLTIEEKLSLVQQMKSQDMKNQSIPSGYAGYTDEEAPVSTLKLRIFVCIIIFAAFFGMYKGNILIKGQKVSKISTALEKNMLPKSLDKSLEAITKKAVVKVNEAK